MAQAAHHPRNVGGWGVSSAQATLTGGGTSRSGKESAFNSLSCVAGEGACMMCGSGSDRTCKEGHESCYWITY